MQKIVNNSKKITETELKYLKTKTRKKHSKDISFLCFLTLLLSQLHHSIFLLSRLPTNHLPATPPGPTDILRCFTRDEREQPEFVVLVRTHQRQGVDAQVDEKRHGRPLECLLFVFVIICLVKFKLENLKAFEAEFKRLLIFLESFFSTFDVFTSFNNFYYIFI